SASLLFLFNESYTMFGGNILSTLTGEFCYMIAFALFAYFMGTLYKGVRADTGVIKNGILLGLIGLTHLFVFIPAVCLLIYWCLAKGTLQYLFKVSLIAFGLMAFWVLPLIAYRDPFTTPVYMIWQPFVSWHYAFMGIGIVILFIGPRLALAALSTVGDSRGKIWIPVLVAFSSLAVFTLCYLLLSYWALGKGLWDTGLEITPLSASPLGPSLALRLEALIVPLSLAAASLVMLLGLHSMKQLPGFRRFCAHFGSLSSLALLITSVLGLHYLICRTIPSERFRAFLLDTTTMVFLALGIAALFFFFYKRITAFLLRIAQGIDHDRFTLFLCLSFGCVVGYFSAHFLEVPDIRFLPPLLFVLMLILFADTPHAFLGLTTQTPSPQWLCRNVISRPEPRTLDSGSDGISRFLPSVEMTESTVPLDCGAASHGRGMWAVGITYLCLLAVIFGATRADVWFRFNNRGYDLLPGYSEFQELNRYLKEAYGSLGLDALNSPRVAYEKSSLYGRYGGDRIFESLPFFSGRQTLEGIHYASSAASRFIAFLQTAYSLEIKTPRSYILSRMNPDSLPAYFDLYNISQVILISEEAKNAAATSPWFEKEKDFGPLSLFRYKTCDGLFVDVPKRVPVLYTGKRWMDDFVLWYKEARSIDLLMVPSAYITNETDRLAFTSAISKVEQLSDLPGKELDRQGVHVEAFLEQGAIRFTTNKVGIPHLVKVSYFPNWKVQGAFGVYPVSPHLMLVIPREKEVVLTYGRTFWDTVGAVITLGTLVFLIFTLLLWVGRRCRFRRNGNRPLLPPLIKGGDKRLDSRSGFSPGQASFSGYNSATRDGASYSRIRPFLVALVLLAAAGLITGGALLRNKPVRAYVAGYKSFERGNQYLSVKNTEAARAAFQEAVAAMAPIVTERRHYDHQDVIHCMLFTAMAYEKLGEPFKAEGLYTKILQEYPYSRYQAEAYVKLGRLKKLERNEDLEAGLKLLQQNSLERGLALLTKALEQTKTGSDFLIRAIIEDPYSVWAGYARQDLTAERAYIENNSALIRSLAQDQEIEKLLLSILQSPSP
ncbi:MAG: hypothetical protein MUC98_01130, partial [Desulfobacterota bacterium]|nr:hypothetical protein [Thermodesulfobacteriota bacterium]